MFKKTRLRRKTLEELAEMMPELNESETSSLLGGYRNDCFWRCVAWIKSGGTSYSESDAEALALPYFQQQQSIQASYSSDDSGKTAEEFTDEYLKKNGSGVKFGQIKEYVAQYAIQEHAILMGGKGERIGLLNTSDVEYYNDNIEFAHAVIVLGKNSNGSLDYIDPQEGSNCAVRQLSPEEAKKVYIIYDF